MQQPAERMSSKGPVNVWRPDADDIDAEVQVGAAMLRAAAPPRLHRGGGSAVTVKRRVEMLVEGQMRDESLAAVDDAHIGVVRDTDNSGRTRLRLPPDTLTSRPTALPAPKD